MTIQAVLPQGWAAGGRFGVGANLFAHPAPTRAWAITSNFWSASAYAGNSDNAWNVNFNNGNDNNDNKTNAFQVRLVRGGE